MHLANIAARTGKVLEFDPKTETITNDPEANALVKRKYREHWGRRKAYDFLLPPLRFGEGGRE